MALEINLSEERIRNRALDYALILQPLFERNGWECVSPYFAGIPSVEDLADMIVVDLTEMKANGFEFYGSGRFDYQYHPIEKELNVYLRMDVLYVGEDYNPSLDEDLNGVSQ